MNEHCIEWNGATTRRGYGHLKARGSRRNVRAHRWAWEKFFGPIPNRLLVLHSCDNPRCINPHHLFLGTPADNAKDAQQKGRLKKERKTTCVCGEPRRRNDTYCGACRRAAWHRAKARGWKRKSVAVGGEE